MAVTFDWAGHRLHREYVVRTRGQWIGLLDEDGVPIMDMPEVIEASAANARGTAEDLELTFAVQGRTGRVHRAVAELIADGLGDVDAEGKLVPANIPTRFVMIQRPGLRYTYKVAYCVAEGDFAAPTKLQVHGVQVASLLLGVPAWSYPISVTGQWHRLDRDFAAEWSKEMDLQNLETAAQADGFTITGPGIQAVNRVVTESLTATWKAIADPVLVANPPIQVATPNLQADSPTVFIQPTDDNVWDTVVDVAQMAGVEIEVEMWLPGDPAPTGLTLTQPTVVVNLKQGVGRGNVNS